MGDGTKTPDVTGQRGNLYHLREEVRADGGNKTIPPEDSFSLDGNGGNVLTAQGRWDGLPKRVAQVFFRPGIQIPTTPPPAVPPMHMILAEEPDFDRLIELWKATFADHCVDDIARLSKQRAHEAYVDVLEIISGQFSAWRAQTLGLVSAYEARATGNNVPKVELPELAYIATLGKFIEAGGIPFDRLIVLIEAMRLPVGKIRDDAIKTARSVLEKFNGVIPNLPDTYRNDAEEIHTTLDDFRLGSPPIEVVGLVGQACVALSYRFGFSITVSQIR